MTHNQCVCVCAISVWEECEREVMIFFKGVKQSINKDLNFITVQGHVHAEFHIQSSGFQFNETWYFSYKGWTNAI